MKIKWPLIISSCCIVIVSFLLYDHLYPEKSLIPRWNTKATGVITYETDSSIIANIPFKLKVSMDTQGEAVNASGIYIHFDASKLQILEIDTTGSFCQFYPEKKFDNNEGTISLACGAPHPGFKGVNTLMELTLLPRTIGSTTIRTDPKSQLLLSDGKGTNILTEYPQQTINITNKL